MGRAAVSEPALSLCQLYDPAVLADPYPLYHRLRAEAPVYWDPLLCSWVVTRYADIVTVLHRFSARRVPDPEELRALGLGRLSPIAAVMARMMLFMDAPAHTRLRSLAAHAFTPRRVDRLRAHIQEIVDSLLDAVVDRGRMDVMAEFANRLPAIVTAEMLGVPPGDHEQLKAWSAQFAEIIGNFQHNPDHAERMSRVTEEMAGYFRAAIHDPRRRPGDGLIHAFLTAQVDGDRLTEEEIVANCMITMVGGQETTTNLIGNGILTLLRQPEPLARLRADPSLVPAAVEELLRYEPPTQHTARVAADDLELGGQRIRRRQGVITVLAAGNRDPERFPDPDRLDIERADNRHLSFGWSAHFCFGAPLARIEAQTAFATMLRRLPGLRLEPQTLRWRSNLALRGLTALDVAFGSGAASGP
jgi:cytochrome P450